MSLRVENLTKAFGEHLLFRQLRFTIDGPAVLWAPSGWGKTTLLRILMGLEQPDSGRADGVGRVAAVFQEDRLCPQLTAVDNVLLVLPDGRAQRQDVQADFAFLGMEGEALTLPRPGCPEGRSGGPPCCAPCGPERTPACLTNPLPAWIPPHGKGRGSAGPPLCRRARPAGHP